MRSRWHPRHASCQGASVCNGPPAGYRSHCCSMVSSPYCHKCFLLHLVVVQVNSPQALQNNQSLKVPLQQRNLHLASSIFRLKFVSSLLYSAVSLVDSTSSRLCCSCDILPASSSSLAVVKCFLFADFVNVFCYFVTVQNTCS